MATVLQPFDSSQQNQPQNPQQNQGSPQGSPTSATPAATPQSPSAPTNSGSYVNLQKYMNANQDFNQQGGGFSGAVTGNINQQSQQVAQNTQAAQNAFQNNSSGNFNAFAQNQGVVNQALANPTDYVQNNPQAAQQFQSVLNAKYTGPNSLQDLTGNQNYNNLQNQAQSATTEANQTQNESGRMNLLNQMFGNSKYAGGQRTLDQLFLQNSPQAQQQFAQSQQQANTASQGLNQAQQQSQAVAQNYAQQAQNMSQQAQQGLTASGSGLQNTVNQEVASANASGAYQNALSGVQNNYQLDPSLASKLGVSGNTTYGVDLSQYLAQAAPATAANAATAQDYAKFSALQQLQGTGTEVSNFLNSADASKAGTYNPYTFNASAANAAVAQNQQAYQQALAGTGAVVGNDALMKAIGEVPSYGGFAYQRSANLQNAVENAYKVNEANAQYMSANKEAQQTAQVQAARQALEQMATLGTAEFNSGLGENRVQAPISQMEQELINLGNHGQLGQYSW
jgi:hypothetical protein